MGKIKDASVDVLQRLNEVKSPAESRQPLAKLVADFNALVAKHGFPALGTKDSDASFAVLGRVSELAQQDPEFLDAINATLPQSRRDLGLPELQAGKSKGGLIDNARTIEPIFR